MQGVAKNHFVPIEPNYVQVLFVYEDPRDKTGRGDVDVIYMFH